MVAAVFKRFTMTIKKHHLGYSPLPTEANYAKGIIFHKTEIVDILLSLSKIKDVKIADNY